MKIPILFLIIIPILSFQVIALVSVANVSLNATTQYNLTIDNLTCRYNLNDTSTIAGVSWYKNNNPATIVFFPFEGNSTNALLDFSGNGFNATNSGAVWNATGGITGHGAFFFNGNAFLNISRNSGLEPATAVSMLFRIKWNNAGSSSYAKIGGKTTASAVEPYFSYMIEQWQSTNGIRAGVNVAGTRYNTTPYTLATNIWYDVGMSWTSGGYVRLYINGTEVANVSTPVGSITYYDSPLRIGFSGFGEAGTYLNASISDLRVYGYVLSPQQFRASYLGLDNTKVSQELTAGDVWQCKVIPFNASTYGTIITSNNVTINAGAFSYLILNSTEDGSNYYLENLTCNYAFVGSYTTSAVTWYKNNVSQIYYYLPMEGNSTNALLDFSGSNILTTNVGAAAWASNTGFDGNGSFNFDGATEYLNTNNRALNQSDNFSICLRFKTATTASAQHMIWQGINTGNGWGDTGAAGTPEMHISIGSNNGAAVQTNSFSFFMGISNSPAAGTLYINSSTAFTDTSSWHSMCVVVSNTTTAPFAALYFDGVLNGTDTGNIGNMTRTAWNVNLTIANCGANTRLFNGNLDDVRIYNYSIDADEVSEYHRNTIRIMDYDDINPDETWQCKVTPFSATTVGTTQTSNSVIVQKCNVYINTTFTKRSLVCDTFNIVNKNLNVFFNNSTLQMNRTIANENMAIYLINGGSIYG